MGGNPERVGQDLVDHSDDFECNLGTGQEAARLIAEIGSPSLRALWDPGNAYFVGETPFPTGYGHVKGLIAHVHAKDAARDPADNTARWVALGSGDVDLLGQLRALKADGYAGVITLESHYLPPGGGKADGVRESFQGLQRLMEQLV
jgi:sugar phosphate isomerase/epimerase